jgi:acetoin utilization protein AcuB
LEDDVQVRALMKRRVVTVSPDDTSDKVFSLFAVKNIRHLPVVENGKLVGIVSDRDLKRVMGPQPGLPWAVKSGRLVLTLSTRRVGSFMPRALVTIAPDAEATEAASTMIEKKIGALPVVERGALVGIVTATDLLRAYVRLARRASGGSARPRSRAL